MISRLVVLKEVIGVYYDSHRLNVERGKYSCYIRRYEVKTGLK